MRMPCLAYLRCDDIIICRNNAEVVVQNFHYNHDEHLVNEYERKDHGLRMKTHRPFLRPSTSSDEMPIDRTADVDEFASSRGVAGHESFFAENSINPPPIQSGVYF